MRALLWLPLAVLVGLVLGSWGPRRELRAAREELERSRTVLEERGRARDQFGGVTSMLGVPDSRRGASGPADAAAPRPERAAAEEGAPAEGPPAGPDPAPAASDPSDPSDGATNGAASARRSLQERIDEAVDLWRARSAIARNTFIANTGLNGEEAAQFDVLVQAMNLRLAHVFEQTAGRIKEGGPVTPETGVRIMSEVTAAMVLTYDEMDRTLPATWRRDAGPQFDLVDVVDPGVLQPLVEVQDELGAARSRRRFIGPEVR